MAIPVIPIGDFDVGTPQWNTLVESLDEAETVARFIRELE